MTPPPPPPGPFVPPKPKPKPKPACLALTVTPKLVRVDGKPDAIAVKVTSGKKAVRGVKVLVTAPGVHATGRTNANGTVVIKVNVKKAGVMTISIPRPAAFGQQATSCGPKRIGVVGIFPPRGPGLGARHAGARGGRGRPPPPLSTCTFAPVQAFFGRW